MAESRKLILIKHTKPEVQADVPSHLWKLSEEGAPAALRLADRVRPYEPQIVISSEEPKASETGSILAAAIGCPCQTAPGLQEHDRSNVELMPTREFISYMALFFKKPRDLVLGKESADTACTRLERAVEKILAERTEPSIAIITHGTVLSLLLARKCGEDGFRVWRAMGLPSLVAVALPEWKIIERLDRV